MKVTELVPAISSEPIFAKSKFYIQRALRRKEANDLDEYQLWASLALELLGKAALASIHPSLIIDPTHYQSLFAATGINISTDIKTIAAHTLFERLRHLAPKFEEPVKLFCNAIAQRRNAELHSGDTPFKTMKLEAWEARYWHAAQLILNMMKLSLDEWLGASDAKAPKQLLLHATKAKADAVVIRVQQAMEKFNSLKKAEREQALSRAQTKNFYEYRDLFRLLADAEWEAECPACSGKAYLAGMIVSEEIVDSTNGEDGAWEFVERSFVAEEFHCPVCDLQMQGSDEIEAAGMSTDHEAVEQREQEHEQEYGNC
jgi:hypothetical protein